MTDGEKIALRAAGLFKDGKEAPVLPSESGPTPEPQNSCEGNDCVNYDFPFDVGERTKGPHAG